jgi:isochorismate synthase EntC
MGQRTLAFTKQMLRVFDLVELKEFVHLVVKAWSSIPRSSETDRILFALHSEYQQAQKIDICICIRTLHHSNKNIIKFTKQNRARYYGHARKRNAIVGATVEKLARLR